MQSRPTILMTGSTGLLGRHLVRELARDHAVVGMDLKPPPETLPEEDWIHCDLTDDDSVRDALRTFRSRHGERLASVIHLAAYYDFSGEESPLYETLTVAGTRRLIRGLQDLEAEQFVFSSSLLVMKPAEPGGTIDESSPTSAEWAYPRSKLRAEAVIHESRGSIPSVLLRIAGVYDDDCHSLPIGEQIMRIHQKRLESFLFPGSPDRGQPFVHLDDLARCVRLVVERRGDLASRDPDELFLVAEPRVVLYRELQERIGEILHGHKWPTIRIPAPMAKAGAWVREKTSGDEERFIKPWMIDLADAHYPVSIERARERLGWRPRARLLEKLRPMLKRLKDDPVRWYETNDLPLPEELETGSDAS